MLHKVFTFIYLLSFHIDILWIYVLISFLYNATYIVLPLEFNCLRQSVYTIFTVYLQFCMIQSTAINK